MEPVSSDTPRDQGNVLDCTGFQNLSHPTHQGTREMYWIVQDVGILRFCHRMLENQVTDCTNSTVLAFYY